MANNGLFCALTGMFALPPRVEFVTSSDGYDSIFPKTIIFLTEIDRHTTSFLHSKWTLRFSILLIEFVTVGVPYGTHSYIRSTPLHSNERSSRPNFKLKP